MNVHRGVVNRLLWMQDDYRLDADDRVLQKTPFTFDVSVWEFFWPLMTGATLVWPARRPPGPRLPGRRRSRATASPRCTSCRPCCELFLARAAAAGCRACAG